MVLFILMPVLLSGCRKKDNFPLFQMERQEDYTEILYIDGIQYRRDSGKSWDEQAHYSSYNEYVWTPAEGIGEQIGICGRGAEKGGGLAVYEIAGDDDRIFLYTYPRNFYFGGTETRLWMREDVSLGVPTAEMVSSVTAVSEKEEIALVQTDDPVMISLLLESFNNGSRAQEKFKSKGEWSDCFLVLHHKDYPFLQYKMECCFSLDQGTACCQNQYRKWFVLPEEWFAALAEAEPFNQVKDFHRN